MRLTVLAVVEAIPVVPASASYPVKVTMLAFVERVIKPSEVELPATVSRLPAPEVAGIVIVCTGLAWLAADGRYSKTNTGVAAELKAAEPSPNCVTMTLPKVKAAARAPMAIRPHSSRLASRVSLVFMLVLMF